MSPRSESGNSFYDDDRICIDLMFMHFTQIHLKILGFAGIVLGFAILALGMLFLSLDGDRGVGAKTPLFSETTCNDFTSWESANDHFESLDAASFEARILDSNGNGVPCEGLVLHNSLPHEEFDVICDDFQHRDEAEYFFERYDEPNSNLYGIDRDLDGRPCEALPPLDEINRVLSRLDRLWSGESQSGGDADCDDFDTWEEANAFFLNAGGPGSDPHRLDGDNNGIPCESLPGAPSES